MKSLFSIFSFLFIATLFVACGGPEGEKVEAEDAVETTETTAADAVTYNVDRGASQIVWTGAKPTGTHTGTVSISDGKLMVADGNITGGEFMLDMGSITVTDLKPGEGKEDLEGHLKTGDFFEVEKYPSGKFVITGATPVSGNGDVTHNLTGNLTMKNTTKSVTIPVNVAVMDNKISAQSKAFKIDRTEWGINYNSGSLADTAKDKIINDEIGLVVTLVANK